MSPLKLYQELSSLRLNEMLLSRGWFCYIWHDANILVYTRELDGLDKVFTVVLNFGETRELNLQDLSIGLPAKASIKLSTTFTNRGETVATAAVRTEKGEGLILEHRMPKLLHHQEAFKDKGLRDSRATAGDIAHYYQDYVVKKGLSHNFFCGTVVTAVDIGSTESGETRSQQDGSPLFVVSGFMTSTDGSQQPFRFRARNVVLATGTSDNPARLGIVGEDLPYVHYDLSALEEAMKAGDVTPTSDPVLIVGAGLSAADAILYARRYNLPVIHAFRRPVDDPGLIFNQLPKTMYPEYQKVHQMMREKSVLSSTRYKGYLSLPKHQPLLFQEDHEAVFQDQNGEHRVFRVSLVLVLIGSYPDLSFLTHGGTDLTVDPDQPLSPKRNPIEVDPFTYQSTRQRRLYAMGPLVGDNFVRFVQGGALAVASSLLKENRKPP